MLAARPAGNGVGEGSEPGGSTAPPATGDDEAADPAPFGLLASTTTAVPQPERGSAQRGVAAAEGAARPSTTLAVAVLDRATGELAVGNRGSEPFLTASLSKIVLAVDVLDRRRTEGLMVSDADVRLIQRALGPSDDTAMSALWGLFDGPGAAGRIGARLDLSGVGPPRDRSQWGEMSVPAVDMVRIWAHILDGMPVADREILLGAMRSAPPRARDGFDQAYGLLVPGAADQGSIAKQGWMCCISGTYYLNSAGALGSDSRFLVTLLTRQPRGPGWEAARQELDRIAIATGQALQTSD
ncbi:hypothetical protein [Pseudonocardia sp. TRM90224]|uniref:hypothetical protein n=1 Tax=Pseudonocardia sp. TRM90224 TaxID=2812678 RepID=UPI001E3A336C|nr:hypothetical protein [Pseudonocardia sp. TRM90224]